MSEQLPIIDWGQHAQASTGTMDMSKELLMLFIQQLPELEERFQQAFAKQDKEELHAVMHRLQGACAYCGLPRLRSVIATVAQAHKQTAQLSQVQFEQISKEMAIVKEELTKHGIKAVA